MSYENAPATKLLATHCLCCNRPLVDAKSVEIGIGPVCRSKHGYDADIPDELRVQANKLIYEAAALASRDQDKVTVDRIIQIAQEIEAIGLDELAEKVRARFIRVRLEDTDEDVRVFTPYSMDFVELLKRAIPYKGRRWDKEAKCWRVLAKYKRDLLYVLSETFPAQHAIGGKGAFTIPTPEEFSRLYRAA